MPRAQRGAAGRRGPLPWASRGSCGIVGRIQKNAVASGRAASRRTVKRGPAARSRRSGHGKVAQGKFRPQHCDVLLSLVSPVGGGSRFRVLEDPESDDCASAPAPRPAAPRPAAPARSGRSGHGKLAQGKFRPQHRDVLLSLVSPAAPRPDAPRPDAPRPAAPRPDAPRPAAPRPAAPHPAAPRPDAPRPRKTTLQQVNATDVNRVSSSRKQDDDTSVTWSGARGRT